MLTSSRVLSTSNTFGKEEPAFLGSSEREELSSDFMIPGSFSHLGIFPGALLNTCGASCMLAGSGCSLVFLSLPTSGSDRDGTVDSEDDEAEGTNDLDKHLRKKISK